MHLLIKVLDPRVKEWYESHGASHVGDSGFDLFTLDSVDIAAMRTGVLNFGIAIEALTDSGEPTSFWMVPRSSISKSRLRMANSVGLIDAGYRGPLKAYVDNFTEVEYSIDEDGKLVASRSVCTVEEKSRLFQLVAPGLEPITFELVDELSETTRGTGGFGSTGK